MNGVAFSNGLNGDRWRRCSLTVHAARGVDPNAAHRAAETGPDAIKRRGAIQCR